MTPPLFQRQRHVAMLFRGSPRRFKDIRSRMRISLALTAIPLLSAAALAAAPPAPVPVSQLVAAVTIPHEEFTLPNGLRVIVSTDHKAPVVAVSIWYHVGSKDEPKGSTGFAHLFEHLMFNGSEHAPGDYFEALQHMGATDYNGTTYFDRTNYFETVPTGAVETALFLEADRMGHLLGGIDQAKLDNQRGVVQNEKRQGDNEPFGLVQYAQAQALFPDGHPYQHTTIGSMADIDQATLDTVKGWFQGHYGPNNAVLALAGDIDVPTAKRLVAKYFGPIARGPQNHPAEAAVPTLAAPRAETLKDQVAATRLYRMWAVPGLDDPDTVPLDMAASLIGGIASSRLDEALVRGDQSAVSVSADDEAWERVGVLTIQVDVKPGADVAAVNRRLDEVIARFIANGPTPDEVRRAATLAVSGQITGLEAVGGFGGKATTLAEGLLYSDDVDHYRKELAHYAGATPAAIQAAARKWLSRPAYALTVEPGVRAPYEEARAGANDGTAKQGAPEPKPAAAAPPPAPAQHTDMAKLPAIRPIADLAFPAVTRTRLSNGIELVYAQRTGTPLTRLSLSFDAGNAADPANRLGTQTLTLGLLDEGTATRTAQQIAAERQLLGAAIAPSASVDRTTVSLSVPSPNAEAAIGLMADEVRNPAFEPKAVDRVRQQQLTGIAAELKDPAGVAGRTLPVLLYGAGHPYGKSFSGSGDPAVVKALSPDDLRAFKARWLRPDDAKIFVVSDLPLDQVRPMLDQAFGDWQVSGAKGVKDFSRPIPAPAQRIVLIDRPGAPQSQILAGQVLALKGTDDTLRVVTANNVLGGDFLSRLNMDLRESKGWSYGVGGYLSRLVDRSPYLIQAPVQTNQTGPAIAALNADIAAFLTTRGIAPEEFGRTVAGLVRELPGQFETGGAVLGAMERNDLLHRPDDYYATLATKYRALTAPELDEAIRAAIRPGAFTWVVVGDAAKVKPQLAALGIPVQEVTAK